MLAMPYTIQKLSEIIHGTVIGDSKIEIGDVSGFEKPIRGGITFLLNPKDLPALEKSEIACIIVPKNITKSSKPLIQTDNPKLAFAMLLSLFHPPKKFDGQISKQAFIAPTAKIGDNVTVEAFAVIGEKVQIGKNSVIRANVHIGESAVIGENSVIHPNVTIYDQTKIGNRVTIHAGAVLGADGFGFVFDGKQQQKVPQVGIVVVHDDVEIGAGTTIDRATVGETVIGKGTKIDNQVQIAHNVEIGEHCAISAKCGISGSCKIGNFVTMGGGAGLADHVEIGDGTMLGGNSGVPSGKKIPAKQIWFGQPARPYQEMRRQIAAQLRAAESFGDVSDLKKRIANLEAEIESLRSGTKN